MEREAGDGEDEPRSRLLPPDDRLWRHPSEVAGHGLRVDDVRRRRRTPPIWSLVAVSALGGSLITIGVVAVTGHLRPESPDVPAVERIAVPAASLSTSPGDAGSRASQIRAELRPAIVALRVERRSGPVAVSGVMFRSDGHLLTNHHVVEGASAITAVMTDGRETAARLVGGDRETDIAVVEVEEWAGAPTAPLGSAAGLYVGQEVVAVAAGGASAVVKVRAVGSRGESGGRTALVDMIETDAAFGPAAAGGALADATGAVVGITTAVDGGDNAEQRSGFATPIEHARSVANQILAHGRVTPVWIGVEGADVDTVAAVRLAVNGGAVVTGVRPTSPADHAGLRAGDVITSVDAAPVRSMAALRVLLRGHFPGDVVWLGVVRGSAAREISVKLAERPGEG